MVAALGAAALPTIAGAEVSSVATLYSADKPGLFSGIASAPQTVVASAPGDGSRAGDGVIDVFTAPGGNWPTATQAATLRDPQALYGPFDPAISGGTVVANVSNASGSATDDVFVEPVGGWSGSIVPAARLAAPSGVSLQGAGVFGSTVVALGENTQGYTTVVYVFVEPAGGWSGTVFPSASLTDSKGSIVGPVAISGQTIFAETSRGVDVFTDPPGGWTGSMHESAELAQTPGAVFVANSWPIQQRGSTVLVGPLVFHEPSGGWSGRIKPSANLSPTSGRGNFFGEAFSGGSGSNRRHELRARARVPVPLPGNALY